MESQIKTGNRKQETGNREEKAENSKLETRNSKPLHHLYLYCFFKGPTSLSPQKGIDQANDTFVLSYRDLCALVSLVSIDEYNQEALNRRLEDLEWLLPKVERHNEIVRQVMEFHPLIPVRFGTIYTSDERLLEILRSSYEELYSFLDFISDKEEWGVKVYKVYAAKGAGGETTEASNELIKQLDERLERISSAKPGEAYLLRKKRGDLVRQQSFGLLNSLSEQIYQQILSWTSGPNSTSIVVKGRRNKLLSKRATGKEDDMILNAVFLVNKSEVETFKEQVDSLAASHGQDGLSFEISGPWPCYNFCPNFSLQQP